MPMGNVVFGYDQNAMLDVAVHVIGLTPGSAHSMRLVQSGNGNVVATFGNLTADSRGAADMTVHSSYGARTVPNGARLEILDGVAGRFGNNGGTPLARLPIADTPTIPRSFAGNRLNLEAGTSPRMA